MLNASFAVDWVGSVLPSTRRTGDSTANEVQRLVGFPAFLIELREATSLTARKNLSSSKVPVLSQKTFVV